MQWKTEKHSFVSLCDKCTSYGNLQSCALCYYELCVECAIDPLFCSVCQKLICARCTPPSCSSCRKVVCGFCCQTCSISDTFICVRCLIGCSFCQSCNCGCFIQKCTLCYSNFCKKCKQIHFSKHYKQYLLPFSWLHCSAVVLSSFQYALLYALEPYFVVVAHR